MKNQLEVFDFNGSELSVLIQENGDPLFIATDLVKILEYRTASDAVRVLDDDEKVLRIITINGKTRETNFITESGLYSLVLRSRKEESKRFKKWITSEVLPSIRKTGKYSKYEEKSLTLPQTYIEALEKLIESEKAKLLLETTIEEQKPKVAFADSLSVSNDSILIGELAKLMTQSGYVIGQNRLFDKLRTMGYLAKIGERRNMPNQKYVEMGLFEIKTTTIITSDGHTKIRQTPKVTAKGQIYFMNKVNKTLGRL